MAAYSINVVLQSDIAHALITSMLQLDVNVFSSSCTGSTVADRLQTNCTILCTCLLPFYSPPHTLTFSHRPSRDSDFCVVELLFLFVPLSPWLPARRLAAPCVKGGCSRTDCGNSRLASPGPLLPNQRGSHQSSAPPAPAHTNAQPNTHSHKKPTTLTPSPNNPRKQFHLDSGGGPLSPAPSIFPY